ncbi:MAG: hypothetical protein A2V88_00740 [Elusimicrobia bacterium RBG_16_66_12]|nr:MAG: hypothetical protein A2V88_00740 [Elusimicrobia bacterium RBG_16_66_12]
MSWRRLPETAAADLVALYAPAIVLLPGDLWQRPRLYYRAARSAHGDAIQLALHYAWDAPSPAELRALRPKWSQGKGDRILTEFRLHARDWGPGDLELVTGTLGWDGKIYRPVEWTFRVRAACYVLAARWLLRRPLRQTETHPAAAVGEPRPYLALASPHHEFHRRGRGRGDAIVLPAAPFTERLWADFRVVESDRGFESWEIQPLGLSMPV